MSLLDIEMKAAVKTRTPKPARRQPAVGTVAVKAHAPAFREIIGLIQSARQRPSKTLTAGETISIVSPVATQSREQNKLHEFYQLAMPKTK